MQFLKSLFLSFLYALRGIWKTIQEERNFRIQLVAIMYVVIFAFFYGLDSTQWAILWLTFCIVPSLEIVNTAIENTIDLKTREQNPNARAAKDLAAAAVLISAITSIIVAVCLFSDQEKLLNALKITFTPPWIIIIAASVFPVFIFIRGGKKDKKMKQMNKKRTIK